MRRGALVFYQVLFLLCPDSNKELFVHTAIPLR
jgi:hypothetical protein